MGGYGSGRRWSSHDTTDGYRRLDVRYMQREGLLQARSTGSLQWSSRGEITGNIDFRAEADRVVLSYKSRERGKDWESLEYAVGLERTRCNFGGTRTWFLCPALGCGRRTAILYGGRIFACRKCYRLAYLSQRQTRTDRASDRAERLLRKLGWADLLTVMDPLHRVERVCTSGPISVWRLSMRQHDMRCSSLVLWVRWSSTRHPFSLFESCSQLRLDGAQHGAKPHKKPRC